MLREQSLIIMFIAAILFTGGCSHSLFILELSTDSQPIQMGPHTAAAPLDTLGIISGSSTHDFREETTYGAETDVIKEDINSTVYGALDDNPAHFIADSHIILEVEQGLSVFQMLIEAVFSSIFGDNNNEWIIYSREIIEFNGIVYKYTEQEKADEN